MSARARRWTAILAAVGLIAGAAAALVYFSGRPPEGPVEVAWDREACAHCRMHVSDPSFAAQLQTESGEVLVFDDPGCAFLYLEENDVRVHALYFHHRDEDRWIPSAEVAFVAVDHSPMGYGLAAVDGGTAGAVSLDDAKRRVQAVARSHAP